MQKVSPHKNGMANNRILGIDIGSSAIKIAQVNVGKDNHVVEEYVSIPLPLESVVDGRIAEGKHQLVVNILKLALKESTFSTKDAIVGLNSSSSVFFRNAVVPIMNDATLKKSIINIVEAEKTGLDMNEMHVSYSVLGKDARGSKLRLMLYLVQDQYVDSLCKAVEDAGLNVVGADISALATLRGTGIDVRQTDTAAIVGIGADITSILMHRSGVPSALFLDSTGAGREASRVIADALDADPESEDMELYKTSNTRFDADVQEAISEYGDMLAQRLLKTFEVFKRNSPDEPPVRSITLVGGGSFLQGLARVIQNHFDLAIQYGKPEPAFDGDLALASLHLTAIGLAIGATR